MSDIVKKIDEQLNEGAKGKISDEFVDYFNSFYGPKGLYTKANKTGKPYTKEQLEKALAARDKERKFEFAGDSVDRETLALKLVDMKLINPKY